MVNSGGLSRTVLSTFSRSSLHRASHIVWTNLGNLDPKIVRFTRPLLCGTLPPKIARVRERCVIRPLWRDDGNSCTREPFASVCRRDCDWQVSVAEVPVGRRKDVHFSSSLRDSRIDRIKAEVLNGLGRSAGLVPTLLHYGFRSGQKGGADWLGHDRVRI